MKVVHRLASISAAIDDCSIAIGQLQLNSELAGDTQKMSEQWCILVIRISQRGDFFLRDDQDMSWCLTIDIPKRETLFVLEQDFSGDLTINDAFENRHF